jgi:hypothetical protein
MDPRHTDWPVGEEEGIEESEQFERVSLIPSPADLGRRIPEEEENPVIGRLMQIEVDRTIVM